MGLRARSDPLRGFGYASRRRESAGPAFGTGEDRESVCACSARAEGGIVMPQSENSLMGTGRRKREQRASPFFVSRDCLNHGVVTNAGCAFCGVGVLCASSAAGLVRGRPGTGGQKEIGRMVDPAKEAVREQVRRRIGALTADERVAKSEAVCRVLLALPEVRAAKEILLYAPLPDEVDVWPAFHALKAAGKRILLPKCLPGERGLLRIKIRNLERDLAPGALGILEPKSNRGASSGELDVVIVPGRAFDGSGNRIGRGAGHYDRFLSRDSRHAFKCGVGFDCQLFDAVPAGPRDVPVDAVVTESGVIRIAAPSDKKRRAAGCRKKGKKSQRSPVRSTGDDSARRPKGRD